MIRCVKLQTSPQTLLEALSEVRSEPRVSVWHDTNRNSMQSNNLPHVLVCQKLCRLPHSEWLKCADLVRRSTTTHTAFFPFGLRGRVVTKSIVTCSHFYSDIGKVIQLVSGVQPSLAGTLDTSPHIVRSLFIAFHQKYCFRSWYILVPPGCIE